jgi:hypothetical protein
VKESVIFAGDSYTWGEGLQLYIDNEFWINERNNPNDWLNLKPKCNSESEKFREENRFSGIVSNHFEYNLIAFPNDGVTFWESVDLVEKNLQVPNLKFIVYQFTILDRLPIIIDNNFLYDNLFSQTDTLSDLFKKYIQYKIFNKQEYFESERKINRLNDVYNLNINQIISLSIEEINNFYYNFLCEKFLNKFIENYIKKWQKKCPVYFIDSWFPDSSNIIQKFETIQNNLVPLIGTDGKFYKKWSDWESTFKYRSIIEEFKNTGNGHPTFEQHKYLAESIIKFINER